MPSAIEQAHAQRRAVGRPRGVAGAVDILEASCDVEQREDLVPVVQARHAVGQRRVGQQQRQLQEEGHAHAIVRSVRAVSVDGLAGEGGRAGGDIEGLL